MRKRKSKIGYILLLGSYLIICNIVNQVYPTKPESNTKQNPIISTENVETPYGILEITKLGLKQTLFSQDDPRNHVDQNVTILKESQLPDQNNSTLILAAHSGTGPHAYFNDIHKLQTKDDIIVHYQKVQYTYQIQIKYEEDKNGYIHLPSAVNKNRIVLTTCSQNNQKQLVLIGVLTKKERET